MKYICFGYIKPGKFENMSASERNATYDECFEYNDELRKNGHLVAGDRTFNLLTSHQQPKTKGFNDFPAVFAVTSRHF